MEIRFTRRKLKSIGNDTQKSAEAVNLVYVSDSEPGIRRVRQGKSFVYKRGGKTVTDMETLGRIRSLVLPPAWENVWICAVEQGHLQATGIDVKGRKQYKYHPNWNSFRNHTKFFHMHEFGEALPGIRKRIQKAISQPGLPQEKVLATVVSLMQCTCIRIGSNMYEKLYGSFGLTTLKDQHVKFEGSRLKFSFKGKKGVFHDITLKSRKLTNIVKQCRDIPGKELFQYYDEQGNRRSIDSGMVNNYIKEISGGSFTAKDFRTWAGTLHALEAFKQLGPSDTATETKRKTVEALDMVAKQLGNTRTVCKKYYVHPSILDLYADGGLQQYLSQMEAADCEALETGLSKEEKIMMKILEAYGTAVMV